MFEVRSIRCSMCGIGLQITVTNHKKDVFVKPCKNCMVTSYRKGYNDKDTNMEGCPNGKGSALKAVDGA